MLRCEKDLAHRAFFDDAAGVHHRDSIGMAGDDAQVVRDEQQREMKFLLHLFQQVEDLRLNRDIERRRGLVGNQQERLAGERDGNQDTLPHAARKLMRIVASRRSGSVILTAVSSSMAFVRASERVALSWTSSASAIWWPMV